MLLNYNGMLYAVCRLNYKSKEQIDRMSTLITFYIVLKYFASVLQTSIGYKYPDENVFFDICHWNGK